MPTVTGFNYNYMSGGNTQPRPASVPLSVYRDLAAELQAAQATINRLTAQNQHLAQENQLLRQEIAKTVQSVLHLQNLLDPSTQASYHQVPRPNPDVKRETQPRQAPSTHSRQRVPRPPRPPAPPMVYTEMEIPADLSEQVFIEEQQVSYYPHSEPEPGRIRGWWLLLAIIFIILLGFGAGYLVVRPFFEHHSR